MSSKIVVLMAHGNMDDSILNKRIKTELKDKENIIYKDLTSLYQDFKIDIKKEQNDLLTAKKIIFQFPMYWYSAPAILKRWVDEVFSYGYSYKIDEDGEFQALALKDKEFQMIVTMGAKEDSFVGKGRLSVKECLNSYSYTAKMLGMKEREPFLVYGAAYEKFTDDDLEIMISKLKQTVL
jgi:glutathione-regulated potassium-efflux system ancillary protein KefG